MNPIIASTDKVSGPGNNSFFHTLDGKELYTCYHTHTIKIVGGGNRKVTIDRCGFREDGSFYVNGPTTTHQTPFSGHGSFEKLEPVAVTAQGTIEGRSTRALTDGETLNSRNEGAYEWRAERGENVYAEFDFGAKKGIDCIYLYGSSDRRYEAANISLIFDDGRIDNICVRAETEEPLVLCFDRIQTQKVRIAVKEYGEAEGFGLSEVLFYNTNED